MLHDSRKITDNVELSYTCLVWYFSICRCLLFCLYRRMVYCVLLFNMTVDLKLEESNDVYLLFNMTVLVDLKLEASNDVYYLI